MAIVSDLRQTLNALALASRTNVGAGTAQAWLVDNGDWLHDVIQKHQEWLREAGIEKLQKAYDGFLEDIDIREKGRGDGINNKLHASYAQLAIDMPTDYMIGRPPTFHIEDPAQEDKESKETPLVEEYRKALNAVIKPEISQRVFAENMRQGSIAGYSCIICWIDEDGEICYDEYPVQECIPVYDTRGRMVLFIRYYQVDDIDSDTTSLAQYTRVEVYDEQYVTYYRSDNTGGYMLDDAEVPTGNPYKHGVGMIPVAVYTNCTAASYEQRIKRNGVSDLDNGILSIITDYAHKMSDKANTVEYLLDQYLLLQGCDTDEGEVIKMRKARALVLKGDKDKSAASFIAQSQDDTAVENHLTREKDTIYDMACIPRLNDLSGATATEIKIKYTSLNMKASKKETYFIQTLLRFTKIITRLINAKYNKNYSADWVTVTLNRNLPQNNKEVADIVKELVDVVPDKYLLELLWFVKDAQKALDELKAQKKENAKNNMEALGFSSEFTDTGSNTDTGTGNKEDQKTDKSKDEEE